MVIKKKLAVLLTAISVTVMGAASLGTVMAHGNGGNDDNQGNKGSRCSQGHGNEVEGDDIKGSDKHKNCANICRQGENGAWVVSRVSKEDVTAGDFAYSGPTNKQGQPTEGAVAWCKENTPTYACTGLTVAGTGTPREIKATVATSVTGGASIMNVEFDFGDSTTPDSGLATSDSHTYAKDGTYDVNATVTFNVNGLVKTADCAQSVVVVTSTTTTVNNQPSTPAPSTPSETEDTSPPAGGPTSWGKG